MRQVQPTAGPIRTPNSRIAWIAGVAAGLASLCGAVAADDKKAAPAPAREPRPGPPFFVPQGPGPIQPDLAPPANPAAEAEAARRDVRLVIRHLPEERQAKYLKIVDVTDQAKLAGIALEDSDPLSRDLAAGLLIDQPLLAKVALESEDRQVRTVAVRRITGADLPSLLRLINGTKDETARRAAIQKVRDPELKAKLLQRDRHKDPRPGRLGEPDTGVLGQDPKKDPKKDPAAGGTRDSALLDALVTTDQGALYKIAMEEADPRLAQGAAAQLTHWKQRGKLADGTMIDRIALGAKSAAARREAVVEVRDPAVLAKACVDPDASVRRMAGVCVQDQAVLGRLATDKDVTVRRSVVNRLTDTALLGRLADSEEDPTARAVAKGRLKQLEDRNR